MVHSLADLDLRLPEMGRVDTLAIVALEVLDVKFHDKGLLEFGSGDYILLNGELHLQAPGVRLRPNELGVNELNPAQAFDVFEAYL